MPKGIGRFVPRISLSQVGFTIREVILSNVSYYQSWLLLLLFPAALTDLRTDRVPNGLIVTGIITGIAGRLWYHADLLSSVVSVSIAFLLLYPLFKIGVMGAGDVKAFMMAGSFMTAKDFTAVLIWSFVIGAVFSVAKLLVEHNGRERMRYFLSYVSEVARARQWKIYGEHMAEDEQLYRSNKIHFTTPLLFGVMLWIGGMI